MIIWPTQKFSGLTEDLLFLQKLPVYESLSQKEEVGLMLSDNTRIGRTQWRMLKEQAMSVEHEEQWQLVSFPSYKGVIDCYVS